MRTRRVRRGILAAALAVVVTGCVLNPPPDRDSLQKEALPHTAIPGAWVAAHGQQAQPVVDGWLASFDDPTLTALVHEALTYNADLQVAAARVEQAAGYVKVAGGALLPSVGFAGITGGKSGGGGSGLEGVFLNASLELDIWGRIRYGKAAAEEQTAALAADYAYARQALAALVAKSWFTAIEAGQLRAITDDALTSSGMLLGVAQDQVRIGNGNEQAVAQANATVGSYRDILRQVDLSREQAVRALELLLGRYPSAELAVAAQLARVPPPAPIGMPSQLLERRPDVIAAERRVAAAFDRVGEAQAAQLPRISLTAGGSHATSELFLLQNQSNPVWSFGANLIAPIYQGGALRAQVEIRSAEQKQAVAEYARVGQRAFGEVEGALSAESAMRDRDAILETTIRDSERALQLAQIQYRVGVIDFRGVAQSQLTLYNNRAARLRVQGEQLARRIDLYLALGGGFESEKVSAADGTSPAVANASSNSSK